MWRYGETLPIPIPQEDCAPDFRNWPTPEHIRFLDRMEKKMEIKNKRGAEPEKKKDPLIFKKIGDARLRVLLAKANLKMEMSKMKSETGDKEDLLEKVVEAKEIYEAVRRRLKKLEESI